MLKCNHTKFAKSPVFKEILLLKTSCSYEISDLCSIFFFFKKVNYLLSVRKRLISHLSSRMGRYKEKLISTLE